MSDLHASDILFRVPRTQDCSHIDQSLHVRVYKALVLPVPRRGPWPKASASAATETICRSAKGLGTHASWLETVLEYR